MNASSPVLAPAVNPNAPTLQKVLAVTHYTDSLFSFRLTRPDSFRFRSGEFVMLGLPGENGKPLLRAYSIASPSWDEELEFYSIKVPGGPLTSKLEKIQPGDEVLLGRKPVGTLVMDALTPAKRLYMFSTGTGFAPFASLIREPESYEKFEQVIVTHTCRNIADLAYSQQVVDGTLNHEFLGDMVRDKLVYFTTVTQEEPINLRSEPSAPGAAQAAHLNDASPRSARPEHSFPPMGKGRITEWIQSGKLFEALGIPPLNPTTDRVMICGSTPMTLDTKALCEATGLTEGANSKPAEFVVERAFVG